MKLLVVDDLPAEPASIDALRALVADLGWSALVILGGEAPLSPERLGADAHVVLRRVDDRIHPILSYARHTLACVVPMSWPAAPMGLAVAVPIVRPLIRRIRRWCSDRLRAPGPVGASADQTIHAWATALVGGTFIGAFCYATGRVLLGGPAAPPSVAEWLTLVAVCSVLAMFQIVIAGVLDVALLRERVTSLPRGPFAWIAVIVTTASTLACLDFREGLLSPELSLHWLVLAFQLGFALPLASKLAWAIGRWAATPPTAEVSG